MNKIIRNIGVLFTLALVLAFSSCVDYDDASGLIDIKVQIMAPSEYKEGATIGEQKVTIKNGKVEMSAMTDESGLVVFHDCMPDVYDISTAWNLSASEYYEKTGKLPDGQYVYVVTASLIGQLFTEEMVDQFGHTPKNDEQFGHTPDIHSDVSRHLVCPKCSSVR